MTNFQPTPEGKDPVLWEIAQNRASFKNHLITYILVNLFLWILWYITGAQYGSSINNFSIPWPIWPTLGWGIGIASHYAKAYIYPKSNSTENEYQKLINKK